MKRAAMAGFVLLFIATYAAAQQNSRLDGCLAQQDNNYVLVQTQPRTIYRLEGKPQQLKQHLGERVRIEGRVTRGTPPGLHVASVEKLAPSCEITVPPGSATNSETGKVGGTQVAVPVTTTGTAGQNTPGYQTPAGAVQKPGMNTAPSSIPPQPSNAQRPAAPPDWEKAGQTPEAANTMAEAAQRAQIQPGAPLGTNPAAPQSAGEKPQQPPRTEAATRQDRVVRITGQGCLPEKLTVRPGEAVVWENHAHGAVSVASTRMTAPTGQNGTGAFASGNISGTFRQVFENPGTYQYTCKAGNKQSTAVIEVREE